MKNMPNPIFSLRHGLLAVLLALTVPAPEACARVLAKDYTLVLNDARRLSTRKVISIGDSLLGKGLADKALVYYMVACGRLKAGLPDSERRQVAIAHLRKGNVYYMKGGYADALQAYVDGIKVCEQVRVQRELGRFYNNAGNVYCAFQDYGKGLGYYMKSRELSRKYGDRVNEYKTLVNMTGVCTFLGRTREARRHYRESERLKDTADVRNNFMSLFNHALILIAERSRLQAADVLRKCISYGLSRGVSREYVCSAYRRMYQNFMAMGRRDSAQAYMRLCLDMSAGGGLSHKFAGVLNDYAGVCYDNGDVARAYALRTRYLDIMDSVYDKREFDIVKNSQFIYEMGKTDRQIASLHAKEEEHLRAISLQRTVIVAVAGVLLVVGVLLGMVYRQKRLLDKSYSDLFQVNRDFAASLESTRRRARGSGTRKTSLDDGRRIALAEAVAGVMENTDEFCSPDFSLDRMAELVGSNSKYVSQVINDTYHKNFSNYVNGYRIRLACLRLSGASAWGNYTLRGIGESVGFRSYTTFVTVFRKTTGLTPKLYQEKAAAESAALS